MTIRNELIDELLAGRDSASVLRQDGLLGELKQALLKRLMAAEFDHHMAQDRATGKGRNHRNAALVHEYGLGCIAPQACVLLDTDGDRHTETGHSVEGVAGDFGLGLLIGQSPVMKTPADCG